MERENISSEFSMTTTSEVNQSNNASTTGPKRTRHQLMFDKPAPNIWDQSQQAFSDSEPPTRYQSEVREAVDAYNAASGVLEGHTFSMNNSENRPPDTTPVPER